MYKNAPKRFSIPRHKPSQTPKKNRKWKKTENCKNEWLKMERKAKMWTWYESRGTANCKLTIAKKISLQIYSLACLMYNIQSLYNTQTNCNIIALCHRHPYSLLRSIREAIRVVTDFISEYILLFTRCDLYLHISSYFTHVFDKKWLLVYFNYLQSLNVVGGKHSLTCNIL